ncbi:MAG: YtxH domain-containing protein [Bacteroidetes bacterium]|nr:YtxH domain-containing protein [Bacteroidota bacterium]
MNGTSKSLFGAALGVAVGLLLAPEKGEDLRDELAESAEKWKNKLGKLIGKANGSLEDLKSYLEKHIDGLSDDVKRKIVNLLDEAQELSYSANDN